MKKLSPFNKIFLILGAVVLAAGLLHTGIAYGFEIVRQHENPYTTSFPPEVMLLLFVPYALALCLLFAVWFCLHERRRGLGRLDVAIRTCAVLVTLIICAGVRTVVFVAFNGSMDFVSVCGVFAPFLAAAAPILAVMSVCILVKKRRAAKGMEKGENEEEL